MKNGLVATYFKAGFGLACGLELGKEVGKLLGIFPYTATEVYCKRFAKRKARSGEKEWQQFCDKRGLKYKEEEETETEE